MTFLLFEKEQAKKTSCTFLLFEKKQAKKLMENEEEWANLLSEKEKQFESTKEELQEMGQMTYDFAAAHDYIPYYLYRQKNISGNMENIGYSKMGQESIYNILIMEEAQNILGLGVGA